MIEGRLGLEKNLQITTEWLGDLQWKQMPLYLQKDFECPRRPHLEHLPMLVQKSNKDDLGCFLETSCHPSSGGEGTPMENVDLTLSEFPVGGGKELLHGEAKTENREPECQWFLFGWEVYTYEEGESIKSE